MLLTTAENDIQALAWSIRLNALVVRWIRANTKFGVWPWFYCHNKRRKAFANRLYSIMRREGLDAYRFLKSRELSPPVYSTMEKCLQLVGNVEDDLLKVAGVREATQTYWDRKSNRCP